MIENTVFIIDDDPSTRTGLTRLLHAAGFSTESYDSARSFLEADRCNDPGCILLDVQMPDISGPELQERLLNAGYNLPIVFLSAHGDVPTTARAMKKGAIDFLTKPVDHVELVEAIHRSLAKDAEYREQQASSSAFHSLLESLTPREYAVMTYVISGLLNKQIAGEMDISLETVKIHRGRVMQKLGVVSVAELVRLCENAGIPPAIAQNR